jgi:hypothetical protein
MIFSNVGSVVCVVNYFMSIKEKAPEWGLLLIHVRLEWLYPLSRIW